MCLSLQYINDFQKLDCGEPEVMKLNLQEKLLLPIVEMCDGWNSLSVNLHNKHVFPTPESPRSRSRKSTSYCLAMVVGCAAAVLDFVFQHKLKSANSALGKNFLCTCNPCLLKMWTEAFRSVLGFVVYWRLVNKTGMLSGSLHLAVGAVDHCEGIFHMRIKLPLLLFSKEHHALNELSFQNV